MDTLEFYNGFTTRFGCRYGDHRPFGGDYSNGWHIKGHAFLDSVIAKNTSGVADSIAKDSTGYNILDTLTTISTKVTSTHGTYVDVGFFHPQKPFPKTIADTDFIDTTRNYMYVLNRRVDSTGSSVGNRYITLVLDRANNALWRNYPYIEVKDMVSNYDTVMYWRNDTCSFTRYYQRAEGKLMSVNPYPFAIDTCIIDNEGVSYNNGIHAIVNDPQDSVIRVCYIRGDSVFTRRIVKDSSCAEVLLLPGGRVIESCDPDGLRARLYQPQSKHRPAPRRRERGYGSVAIH